MAAAGPERGEKRGAEIMQPEGVSEREESKELQREERSGGEGAAARSEERQ